MWHYHVINFTRLSSLPFNFICAQGEPGNNATRVKFLLHPSYQIEDKVYNVLTTQTVSQKAMHMCIIGASMSKPHTSEFNYSFIYHTFIVIITCHAYFLPHMSKSIISILHEVRLRCWVFRCEWRIVIKRPLRGSAGSVSIYGSYKGCWHSRLLTESKWW